jgi:hypothetical protein
VAGCDNGNNSGGSNDITKFEGEWTNDQGVSYVFKDDTWQLVRPGRNKISGTFSATPVLIKFTTTAGGSGEFSLSYELKNDGAELSLTSQATSIPAQSTGTFIKQP